MNRTTGARLLTAMAVLSSTVVVAACGGSGSSGGSGGGGGEKIPAFAENWKPPASGCGSFSAKTPADPDGVIAQLDAEHKAAMGGYADFPQSTVKVLKSALSDWKPTHPAPYNVAISWSQLISDFQVQAVNAMKKYFGDDKNVGSLTIKTTGSTIDIAQQLQQYNQLVQAKPDLIILETPSQDSFNGPVQRAKAAGIPTITLLSPVPVDGAVNVDGNNYLDAAETMSYVSRVMGGKGNILQVRALAGAAVDNQTNEGWDAVTRNCPGMKVGGEIYGGFSESLAKSETLKYLATHPQKIDGLTTLAGESVGTLKAFQQTGRSIPPAAEVGMDKGFLGYWQQNQSKGYHASSTSLPPVAAARALHEVAMRMLAGQGVKLNSLIAKNPVITDANLSDWAEPSWNINTPGTVPGDPQSFMPSKYLDDFFNNPAPIG
ncbi:MAG TPA: substrate-binding domain-containing protein [Candidatus Dormibacteraeota bacterium]|nr:substrate-binding domain-containing protein [Candidatus Dormibacteraeota bacterium]